MAEFYLVYSKNSTDSLPISTTKVDPGACIDPGARTAKRKYYPTEHERNIPECEIDKSVEVLYDPRYYDTGLTITELAMMEESGVYSQFSAMKLFSRYLTPLNLERVLHRVYTRPTIPFKLECEVSAGTK